MRWQSDVSVGDWLRERVDVPWRGTIHDVLPRGFAACARVFHPASRDRPVGRPWPGLPYRAHRAAWEAFQADEPELDDERVTWAATAAALGTTMHPLAQWERLVAPGVIVANEDGPRDAAGWRYAPPRTGDLEPDVVAALVGILARHTATPDDAYIGLWEGSGTLVGHLGQGPSRVFLQFGDPSADLSRHNDMLGASRTDRFDNVFRAPTWQEAILSRDISEGPRLQLPDRAHVLFHGALVDLSDPEWVLRVPWRDRIAEEHGFAPAAHAPNLVWPADRSWVSVTEVDFDSTIVAGSAELVADLCASDVLEAVPLPEDASLTWDADEVNR